MGHRSCLTLLSVALLLATLALPAEAEEEHRATHLVEDVYTEEGTTDNRDILLEGDSVLEAWFNFTVREDIINSGPDSFTFTVTNLADAALTQSMSRSTDGEGRLALDLHVALEGGPRWRVSVTCNDAGDTKIGPLVVEQDAGNAWDLQVDYVYTIDATNGNGGNGNGDRGDGDGDGQPPLVSLLQADLLVVALVSLLVGFLSLGAFFRGGGSLKVPLVLSLVLVLDAFIFLPVALLVNMELNDTLFSPPPYGAPWLGNLALVLLLVWTLPLVLARKRVLGSGELHDLVARVTAMRVADAIRKRADRYPRDPLSERAMALAVALVGFVSVAVVAMMLLA